MKASEYTERLEKIEMNYLMAKQALFAEYAKSKTLYKEGDIISQYRLIILVDRVTWHKDFGMPEPVYKGIELRKDLAPKSSGSRGVIFGNDKVKFIK